MTRQIIALMFAFAAFLTMLGFADEGPAKDVPELQALSNYVGICDVTITSKDSPFVKGEATTKWILDGRFVQQTGLLTSSDGATVIKVTTLMTFDQEQKAYRTWSFFSNGTTTESSGKWDAKNRTMTSIGRGKGTTTTTIAKFAENGNEEWSITTKNQNNDEVAKISGINTRRKN